MKKLLLLLLPFLSFSQIQIGSDINGELALDELSRVSLSADGLTLAVGAFKNDGNGISAGHARVYRFNGNNWTQIGLDLDGEAGLDQFGINVSLSADGNILAVGANGNDTSALESGHVKVYGFNNNTWTQIGANINGLPQAENFSVCSLSADGTFVAIVAYNYNNNGSTYGRVAIYKFINNQWQQIGANIIGSANGDFLGDSISISGNGTKIAIGSFGADTVNGQNSGNAKVYVFDEPNWSQIGSTIIGDASGDSFGDVSLSADGSTLAVGARLSSGNGFECGQVKLFTFNGSNWIQKGNSIYGENSEDLAGASVSLNNNGSVVAIGAVKNDGNGVNSGSTRIYNFNGVSWVQIGIDINGEAANDFSGFVSLSSDGTKVAIGAPLNDGNGTSSGHVRVYDLSNILETDNFIINNFVIFPNPASNILSIQLNKNIDLQKVNLYNNLGQLILINKSTEIDTSALTKQSYIIEIITNKGQARKLFIKK